MVSMGPERVKQTIKEALAKGADRGMHIADDKAHTLDPLGAAKSLAAAIEREKPDLVLTGLQSDDQGFGQTGVLLAERLGLPHATIIMQIDVAGRSLAPEARARGRMVPVGRASASRRADDSVRHQQGPVRDAQRASWRRRKKKSRRFRANRSACAHEPTQRIERIYVPVKTKKTEFLTGTPKEAAAKLLEKLKHEARVL